MGAALGTTALIAIPSLIFGFWPQIKRACEPVRSDVGPGGPVYSPSAEPAPPQPRRCRSCGAAEGEYHDPDRCTDQAALLRQAISLTEQLIQMKQDEIFVKTGQGREL